MKTPPESTTALFLTSWPTFPRVPGKEESSSCNASIPGIKETKKTHLNIRHRLVRGHRSVTYRRTLIVARFRSVAKKRAPAQLCRISYWVLAPFGRRAKSWFCQLANRRGTSSGQFDPPAPPSQSISNFSSFVRAKATLAFPFANFFYACPTQMLSIG